MDQRRILHAHFHLPHHTQPKLYEDLLALAEDITSPSAGHPPDAAHLDITGALRCWQRSPQAAPPCYACAPSPLTGCWPPWPQPSPRPALPR